MSARALAVEDTRTRIREALFELGTTRVFSEISLEDVAQEAGVSVQTVLRHFGSRVALIDANIDYAIDRVARERVAPEGDVDTALAVLIDHYELRGDTVMLTLAQEASDEQVRRLTENGRRMHRDWGARPSRTCRRSRGRRSTSSWSPPTSTPGSCCAATAATRAPRPRSG